MTRDEQIIEASHNYGKTLNEEAAFDYEDMKCAFENGAKWADEHPNLESLWHNASEEPVGNNWEILCQDEMNGCWVENRVDAMLLHNTWNEYASIEMLVRWTYISDLLPKR